MTDNLCAIQGQLVDVRNVFTDKCVKLTIHVSAERAMEVMTAFGWPTNVSPVPVAIARLNADGKEANASTVANPAPEADNASPVRAPRPWHSLPYPQQAAIRLGDPAFIKFMGEGYDYVVRNADDANNVVKELCHVESKRDIKPGSFAGDTWERIDGDYRAWRLAPGVGAA